MLLKVVCTLFPCQAAVCAWSSSTFKHSQKYLQNFPKCSKDFGELRVIFGNLRKSSKIFGNRRKSTKMFRWSSEVFQNVRMIIVDLGGVRVMFGNARKISKYLRLSSEGFGWALSTLVIPRITVDSHECLRTSLGYLRCNSHWCFRFALVFQIWIGVIHENCIPIAVE